MGAKNTCLTLLLLGMAFAPACKTDTAPATQGGADTDTETAFLYDEPLFGAPTEATGLTTAQCKPSCDGDADAFSPPAYTETDIDNLLAFTLGTPFEELTENPYEDPQAHPLVTEGVCAVTFFGAQPDIYELSTFSTAEEAQLAGATVTHTGPCGLCSSFQNLAVYISVADLTDPVRACGVANLDTTPQEHIACIEEIGFDRPCAQIWYYNSINTRAECFSVCMTALDDPYHLPSGAPNACIQCDEDESGDVFKAVAGRTRRNSGLPSALCRPCDTVAHIIHAY